MTLNHMCMRRVVFMPKISHAGDCPLGTGHASYNLVEVQLGSICPPTNGEESVCPVRLAHDFEIVNTLTYRHVQ